MTQKFMVQTCTQEENTLSRWTNCMNQSKSFEEALAHAVYIATARARELRDLGFVNSGYPEHHEEVRPEIMLNYKHNRLAQIHIWYKDKNTGQKTLEAYRVIYAMLADKS